MIIFPMRDDLSEIVNTLFFLIRFMKSQIDLVDMCREAVEYQGKTYRYIMSWLDVFSWLHWLYPLQTKHAPGGKE